jgi:hypothetical protein
MSHPHLGVARCRCRQDPESYVKYGSAPKGKKVKQALFVMNEDVATHMFHLDGLAEALRRLSAAKRERA